MLLSVQAVLRGRQPAVHAPPACAIAPEAFKMTGNPTVSKFLLLLSGFLSVARRQTMETVWAIMQQPPTAWATTLERWALEAVAAVPAAAARLQ